MRKGALKKEVKEETVPGSGAVRIIKIYRGGRKSRFTVVSMQTVFVLVLLLINYCIIFHTSVNLLWSHPPQSKPNMNE